LPQSDAHDECQGLVDVLHGPVHESAGVVGRAGVVGAIAADGILDIIQLPAAVVEGLQLSHQQTEGIGRLLLDRSALFGGEVHCCDLHSCFVHAGHCLLASSSMKRLVRLMYSSSSFSVNTAMMSLTTIMQAIFTCSSKP